jgi:hypothetical protein
MKRLDCSGLSCFAFGVPAMTDLEFFRSYDLKATGPRTEFRRLLGFVIREGLLPEALRELSLPDQLEAACRMDASNRQA